MSGWLSGYSFSRNGCYWPFIQWNTNLCEHRKVMGIGNTWSIISPDEHGPLVRTTDLRVSRVVFLVMTYWFLRHCARRRPMHASYRSLKCAASGQADKSVSISLIFQTYLSLFWIQYCLHCLWKVFGFISTQPKGSLFLLGPVDSIEWKSTW